MAAVRQPQDRKAPAKKAAAKKVTPSASRARAASEAALARKAGGARELSSVSSADLAAEATAVPAERPEGCPEFRPILAMSRRQRADYMRAVDVLASKMRSNPELLAMSGDDADEAERRIQESPSMLRLSADLAEMAADVEDVLRIVAVNDAEFTAWTSRASDDAVLSAWQWYQESQGDAGNASASPA